MGMFDEIICEYKLPDKEVQDHDFQTKDLENLMDVYIITKIGRLIWIKKEYEIVPEQEREFFGTPEWDEKPIVRSFGCMRVKKEEYIPIDYNNTICFYTHITDEATLENFELDNGKTIKAHGPTTKITWYEYLATFKKGKIIKLERYGDHYLLDTEKGDDHDEESSEDNTNEQ